MCRRSEPWVREEVTNRERPVPASQAEKASISIGDSVREGVCSCKGHIDKAMNIESIIPSRQSKVEIRWVRCSANPIMLIAKAMR